MRVLMMLTGAVCAIAILIGVGVNFANIVGRYVFNRPLFWAEDLLVVINAWVVFLGAAVTSFRNKHLSMDILHLWLPRAARYVLLVLICIVCLAILIIVAWLSSQFVHRLYLTGQRSITLGVPMYYLHASVLVGVVLMAVATASHLVRLLRQGRDGAAEHEMERGPTP